MDNFFSSRKIMYGSHFSLFKTLKQFFNFCRAYLFRTSLSPLAVSLQLTNKCNKNCKVCFEKEKEVGISDIDLKIVKKIVTGLDKDGILFLTGGEPFMHPQIWKILNYLKDKKVNFTICTNGSLLNSKNITKLIESNPNSIIFSVHGLKKNHDISVGVEGSFKKIRETIKELQVNDFKGSIIVNAVITPSNYQEIEEIAKKFKNLEIDALRFQHLNFLKKNEMRRAKIEFKEGTIKHYVTTPYININILKKQLKKVKKLSNLPLFFIPHLKDKDIEKWYLKKGCSSRKCLYIHRALYIDATGICHSCQTIRNNIGNLKKDSLFNIFNSKKAKGFRRERKKTLSVACRRCCKLS